MGKGLEKGLETERRLLLRQIRRRFGEACTAQDAPLLAAIDDPERLADIGEWIVETENGKALLARLRDEG